MHVSYKKNKKKRVYFFLYFFFILIMFYAVQDFLTSRNVGAPKDADRRMVHMALFLILMTLGFYFIRSITGRVTTGSATFAKRRITKFPVSAAMWLIAGWIAIVDLGQSKGEWIIAVRLGLSVYWILSYHFFNNYLRRFPDAWIKVKNLIFVMFGFYVYSTLYATQNISEIYGRVAVVNLAYSVLVFLPWIILFKGKIRRRLCICIVFLVVLSSMKRGAIIALPVMLSTSLLVEGKVTGKNLWPQFKLVFVMALFFASFMIASEWSEGFLKERFSYEQLASGSGRYDMYNESIVVVLQRSTSDFLFGRGSASGEIFRGGGAHNEWVEFIFSYGAIGAMLYVLLLYSLLLRLLQLVKRSSPYTAAYAMAVAYMLLVGMFGSIYFTHTTFYIMGFFGAVEGLENQRKR